MPINEALERNRMADLQDKHLETRECKMCGEVPETQEEIFEDGLCPHCANVVETD